MTLMERTYTIYEIAEKCNVHHKTVNRWIKTGLMEGYLKGGKLRVPLSAFLRFQVEHPKYKTENQLQREVCSAELAIHQARVWELSDDIRQRIGLLSAELTQLQEQLDLCKKIFERIDQI